MRSSTGPKWTGPGSTSGPLRSSPPRLGPAPQTKWTGSGPKWTGSGPKWTKARSARTKGKANKLDGTCTTTYWLLRIHAATGAARRERKKDRAIGGAPCLRPTARSTACPRTRTMPMGYQIVKSTATSTRPARRPRCWSSRTSAACRPRLVRHLHAAFAARAARDRGHRRGRRNGDRSVEAEARVAHSRGFTHLFLTRAGRHMGPRAPLTYGQAPYVTRNSYRIASGYWSLYVHSHRLTPSCRALPCRVGARCDESGTFSVSQSASRRAEALP